MAKDHPHDAPPTERRSSPRLPPFLAPRTPQSRDSGGHPATSGTSTPRRPHAPFFTPPNVTPTSTPLTTGSAGEPVPAETRAPTSSGVEASVEPASDRGALDIGAGATGAWDRATPAGGFEIGDVGGEPPESLGEPIAIIGEATVLLGEPTAPLAEPTAPRGEEAAPPGDEPASARREPAVGAFEPPWRDDAGAPDSVDPTTESHEAGAGTGTLELAAEGSGAADGVAAPASLGGLVIEPTEVTFEDVLERHSAFEAGTAGDWGGRSMRPIQLDSPDEHEEPMSSGARDDMADHAVGGLDASRHEETGDRALPGRTTPADPVWPDPPAVDPPAVDPPAAPPPAADCPPADPSPADHLAASPLMPGDAVPEPEAPEQGPPLETKGAWVEPGSADGGGAPGVDDSDDWFRDEDDGMAGQASPAAPATPWFDEMNQFRSFSLAARDDGQTSPVDEDSRGAGDAGDASGDVAGDEGESDRPYRAEDMAGGGDAAVEREATAADAEAAVDMDDGVGAPGDPASASRTADPHASVAEALERVASRIRDGDVSLPGELASSSEEAALAVALAALLRSRPR